VAEGDGHGVCGDHCPYVLMKEETTVYQALTSAMEEMSFNKGQALYSAREMVMVFVMRIS
jgi:hypothetical protein